MEILLTSTLTTLLYLSAAVYKGMQVTRRIPSSQTRTGLILVTITLLVHALSIYGLMISSKGIDLGFFKISSLIFLFIGCIALSASLRGKQIDNLMVALFPLAATAVFLSALIPSAYTPKETLSGGILSHILISILAYSVLTIASLQAVILLVQEKELKKRHTKGLIEWLPPLQTMEELLFEMLWIGIILLSGSIISGAVFLDNIFAQHLAHKTLFSIGAWVIFAILLWGRHQLGWRGKTAVKWTLGGFIALMLAFFGSKFVLELLLHK